MLVTDIVTPEKHTADDVRRKFLHTNSTQYMVASKYFVTTLTSALPVNLATSVILKQYMAYQPCDDHTGGGGRTQAPPPLATGYEV